MHETPIYRPNQPGVLRRGIGILYGIWFGTAFAGLATTAFCLIAITPGMERRRAIARLGAQSLLHLTGAWPNIKGLANVPDGPAVVVANHSSYLDGILLTAVLPVQYRFVIKREVTEVPLVNFFLQRIGAHFVERFDKHKGASDARRIIQTADDGASLAFFPEGTFRAEPGLRPFHRGAFKIAMRGAMPLVPLTIKGTRGMLPAKRLLPRPARLRVIIDIPIETSGPIELATAMQYCRDRIMASTDEPDLTAAR